MTNTEGDYFSHRVQTRHGRRGMADDLLVPVVLVAWLIVLFGGYLVANMP